MRGRLMSPTDTLSRHSTYMSVDPPPVHNTLDGRGKDSSTSGEALEDSNHPDSFGRKRASMLAIC
jgi:hypothetical protein